MIKFDNPAYPEWLAQQDKEPQQPKSPSVIIPQMAAVAFQFAASGREPSWLRSLFCDERGEDPVLQFDGPKMAYYEMKSGSELRRFQYSGVGWQSADLAKLQARVRAWADSIRANDGEYIVWRKRPDVHFENGKYKFYCRLHVMPYRTISEATIPGEEWPEA